MPLAAHSMRPTARLAERRSLLTVAPPWQEPAARALRVRRPAQREPQLAVPPERADAPRPVSRWQRRERAPVPGGAGAGNGWTTPGCAAGALRGTAVRHGSGTAGAGAACRYGTACPFTGAGRARGIGWGVTATPPDAIGTAAPVLRSRARPLSGSGGLNPPASAGARRSTAAAPGRSWAPAVAPPLRGSAGNPAAGGSARGTATGDCRLAAAVSVRGRATPASPGEPDAAVARRDTARGGASGARAC